MNTDYIDHLQALPSTYRSTANQVMVWLDDAPLRVLRYSTFDQPIYVVHASLADINKTRTLRIKVKRKFKNQVIHPARLQLKTTFAGERGKDTHIEFTRCPYVVLECDGLGYLCMMFDPIQDLPQGDGVVSIEQFGVSPDPYSVQTEAIQAAMDHVSLDPNLHTLVVPAGHYRSGDLHLRSNVTLHLSSGAVLQASDQAADLGDSTLTGFDMKRACFINAKQVKNIGINGPGHIDGNRPALDVDAYYKGMVLLTECVNVHIEGTFFSDSCGWNLTPRHCDNVAIRRVKLLNNRPIYDCMNTDGCNPDGCQGVHIDHCFMHTGDDAVAVKSTNYGGKTRNCSDITVTDLLAINNSATAKVGTETMADKMERIHFERIDAVLTARLVVNDAYDYAHIHQVRFKDCHVHQLEDGLKPTYVVDIQAPTKRDAFRSIPGKSTVSKVTLEGISSECPGKQRVYTRIVDGTSAIQGVSYHNLRVDGQDCELNYEEVVEND